MTRNPNGRQEIQADITTAASDNQVWAAENTSGQIKLEKSIRDLRNRLKREIFVENFEEAARIRDEIRQLEKNIYE